MDAQQSLRLPVVKEEPYANDQGYSLKQEPQPGNDFISQNRVKREQDGGWST